MFAKAIVVAGLAALAAAQSASLGFTRVPTPVAAGQTETITYRTDDESSPVTILLRKGASTDLKTVATLTSSSTGGSYDWTPASDLVSGSDYALQITQGDQVNYYGPFSITGGSGSSSSSSASAPAYSSSSKSMVPIPYPSSNSMGSMMTSASRNATVSMTGAASVGTVVSMSRNNTMAHPTVSRTTVAVSSGTGASQSTDSGAGFQGSQTGTAAATSTGGASAMIANSGSVVALVFGAAFAAVFA